MVDWFCLLPSEVNRHVRSYLCLSDIGNLSLVNKLQLLYFKQDYVSFYIGTMFTGYNICLYHDEILQPIAKLLCPLLSEPWVTRYYKITVTGHKMYNGTLGGKINVMMTPYMCAPSHDFVIDWQDDDILDDINNNIQFNIINDTEAKSSLYFDDFLKRFNDVTASINYDSTNSCNKQNRDNKLFTHKLVVDDNIWNLLNNIQLDHTNNTIFNFTIINNCIQHTIVINYIRQMLYNKQTFTNIKLITDCKQYIKSVTYYNTYEYRENDTIRCDTYDHNHMVSQILYDYYNKRLIRFWSGNDNGWYQFEFQQDTYCYGLYFPNEGEYVGLPIDPRLQRIHTLDDDNPYYNSCVSISLATPNYHNYDRDNTDHSKEFICPKII